MRKNRTKHEAKKPRLAKRALALCFALIFVCSCLLPAFANSEVGALSGTQETVVEPQQDEQPTEPVLLNESDTNPTEGNEQHQTADDPTEEPKPAEQEPKNEEPKTEETKNEGTTESKDSAEQQGNEQTKPEEPKNEGTTEETKPEGTTEESKGTTGETKPEETKPEGTAGETKTEEPKQPTTNTTGDTINQGEATYTYRFWPKEIDAFDLEAINDAVKNGESLNEVAQAQVNMVPCTILTVKKNAYLGDFKANVQQPINDGYEFAYWYTVDGTTEDKFSFEDNVIIEDEKSKTIDVFAKWYELVTLKTTTTVNVDATLFGGEAAISLADVYSDDRMATPAPTKTLTLDVEATNLSSNSELSVSSTSSSAIDTYCENNELVPILTLDITPKDEDGNKTEPQKSSTVTISGLSALELPDELTMIHKKDDGEIEKISAQYSNGTLTFEATSFSTYAVAAAAKKWQTGTLKIKYVDENGNKLKKDVNVTVCTGPVDVTDVWAVGAWESVDYTDQTTFNGVEYKLKSKDPSSGKVTVQKNKTSTITLTYSKVETTLPSQYVYLYTKIDSEVNKRLGLTQNADGWFTVGYIEMSDFLKPTSYRQNPKWTDRTPEGAAYYSQVVNALNESSVHRFEKNSHVHLSNIIWNHEDVTNYNTHTTEQFGLVSANGASDYNSEHRIPMETGGQYAKRWHLDGYIDSIGAVRVNYYIKGTKTRLKDSVEYLGTPGETFTLNDAPEELTDTNGLTYKRHSYDPANSVVFPNNSTTEINVYYVRNTLDVTIVKHVEDGDHTRYFDFKVTGDSIKTKLITGPDGNTLENHNKFFKMRDDGYGAVVHGLKKDDIFTVRESIYDVNSDGEEDKTKPVGYDTKATGFDYVRAGNTGKNFTYRVVEENGELVLQPIKDDAGPTPSDTSYIRTGEIVVTNNLATTSLTVEKKVEGKNGATPPENAEFTFYLEVTNENDYRKAVTFDDSTKVTVINNHKWKIQLKANEKVTFSGIRVDDSNVTVTEDDPGTHYTVSYKINDGEVQNSTKAKIAANVLAANKQNGTTVVFTNTYTLQKLESITITKKVTGAFGERDKKFNFSVTLENADCSVEGIEPTSFQLKNGENVSLHQIPVGTTITITETDADDYKTSATGHSKSIKTPGARTFTYKVEEEGGKAVLKSLGEDSEGFNGSAITVENNFDGTPDTGVLLDTLPYLILLAVAVAGGVLVVVRKRKHRDE